MPKKDFFQKVINYLKKKEKRLIEIKEAQRIIFVGDTHGDLYVSKNVIKNYLKKGIKIVFLGDYVDRGELSKENFNFLLEKKLKHPSQIFLLQGNHEGYPIFPFSPADFWESLDQKEYKIYSKIVKRLPLILVAKNIIALHGSLPEISSPKEVENIILGDEKWFQITWGDFVESRGEFLGLDPLSGRPLFGRDWFFKLMKRFKKDFLFRSHQPNFPILAFSERCFTIFSSSVYGEEKTLAEVDFEKRKIEREDIKIIKI